MNPKVSIVIPCYNAEKFIAEALKSVFSQTFTDYEVIVVNDASTDRSRDIISHYADKIKLINLEVNGGEAHARNKALKEASGLYISFLDADDIWRPEKLAKQVSYLDSHPEVGFVYSNGTCFKVEKGAKVFVREFKLSFDGDVFKELFWSNFVPGHTPMVRKTILDQVGYYDEAVQLKRAATDYDLWLRIARVTNFGHISELLADYRLHESNMLGLSYENVLLSYQYIYEKFYSIFPDTKERIGLTRNDSIGDLYLRHAFMDFTSKKRLYALKKISASIKYCPAKGMMALFLIVFGLHTPSLWKHLIWRFDIIYTKFVKRH